MSKTPVTHQDLIAEGPEARCGDHHGPLVHNITILPFPGDEPWGLEVAIHKDKAILRLGEGVNLVANARDTLAALNRAAVSLGQRLAEVEVGL